ncbi:trypsin-like serine peptidase [Streptomonospora litoralis]|uniref:Extracellular metalloprotease n=1 Tax=Streptomonospora litoralis TaxID=2498135 RepID=A0A4P6Q8Q5_9ACTN|nr:trypsin-like serine protease [Streptomonospora litoralis]QBI55629.1 Extracellular metalloprotease precursor [Streptomonospora litoralis]
MNSPVAHKLIGTLLSAVAALGGLPAAEPAHEATAPGGAASSGASAAAAAPAAESAEAPTAPDRPTADEGGVIRQAAAVGADEHRAVLDYWTPRRMAEAAPLVPALNDLADTLLPGSPTDRQAAGPGTGAPWQGGGRVARTTGKVFLALDGRDFTCSAAVVSADNRDTVITAGHCLKDGSGPWVGKWVFVPGYDDGESPYGRYTARQMFVAPQWAEGSDDSYDFGMAVLNRAGGDHVQDRVGAQRIAFGTEPGDPTYSFGYPATGRFEGRRLHYCSGPTVDDDGGTTANGMACTMTEGSSGGPWLSGFDEGSGRGTVVSVISFKYAGDTRTQYGPYLGRAARRVYDRAQSY